MCRCLPPAPLTAPVLSDIPGSGRSGVRRGADASWGKQLVENKVLLVCIRAAAQMARSYRRFSDMRGVLLGN